MPAELHPFLVHLAVGLLIAAPACDAGGLIFRREGLLHAGRWNTLIGTVAAGLAVLSGIAARAELGPHSAAGEALLNLHNAFGYVMLVLWVPAALWRAFSRPVLPGRFRTVYLALAFAAAAACTAETLLGATLVYRHGVGLSPAARVEPLPRPPTLSAPTR
ncbi:MAG TPA: DUF2231 domain-containing protein [Myxococcales bacterium]|jgi:uncharacterized membrane protein|nr:DUF2231 domain-containing protein [Myxococcales bacterium]